MQLAGVVILVDGAQAVLANALRARGDVWPTTIIQIACFGFIMLPAAYLFTLILDWGPVGLMSAIGVATFASALSLAARFRLLALKDQRG
jgi:MATE family multidrug resistance protein